VLVTLTILLLYIILWIYLKGWGKSQKSPPVKIVRFEHKIITVSSRHTCKHILHGLLIFLWEMSHIFKAGTEIWDLDMRIHKIHSGDKRTT
jgi:hypothetical protein